MKYIPSSAKKVFTGVVFDVWQWRQKMFDNTHEIFEVVTRQDTVEVVGITPEHKIIVLRQKQPHTKWFYSLPGGMVNKGEKTLTGALREFREESGYKPKKIRLWKILPPYTKVIYFINIYLGYGCFKDSDLQLDKGEQIEVKLFSFDEFLQLAENPLFVTTGFLRTTLIKALYNQKYRQALKKLFFKS